MIQAANIILIGFAATMFVGAVMMLALIILGVVINPSLRAQLFSYAILGFAFAKATGLFALMMAMPPVRPHSFSKLEFKSLLIPDTINGAVCTAIGVAIVNGVVEYSYYSDTILLLISTILYQ